MTRKYLDMSHLRYSRDYLIHIVGLDKVKENNDLVFRIIIDNGFLGLNRLRDG